MLLLHRTLPATAVVVGIAAALILGSFDADLVAVEARRSTLTQVTPAPWCYRQQSVPSPRSNAPCRPWLAEIGIDRGNLDSVMCGFNALNNDWTCGSDTLLRRILKTEIDFKGFVMTDFGSTHQHNFATSSLRAGWIRS